ncbi:hypothetical protein SAMN05428970_1372 [Agromyces sp. CF514]|uniref:hypothetical protein n=1 Tax=Agromyces sp. CF514 TaxID=1881031 RepID=UPI0008E8707A|nr:hypothetical protein [Agromyces sp. CF514]SFR72500.1 hypothetical protein SAMN05428970_1372 [Agromyces sp. CF514]
MAQTGDQELLARIEALETENARLRVEVEAPAAAPAKPRRSGRGRVAVATVLVIVGVLLAPIAVLGAWAKTQLVDTDTFVATFAPLADDPAVQAFVAEEATTAILDSVDIEGYTSAVFDAIKDLGLPPRAEEALGLLEGPATQGIESLVGQLVNRFVTSDAFGDIFEQALRVTHTQTIAALQGDPDAVLDISSSGELGIQLGPIVAEVKQRLIDAGVGFASAIPEVDRTIVIAQSDALPTVRLVYALAVSAGTWLPWVALAFLVAGILVAPRRRTAIIWTSSALAVSMIILGSGFGVARLYFLGTIAPGIMPAAAAEVIYDQIVDRMVATTVALAIFAVAVALIAWLSGPSALPRKLRGFVDSGFGAVRGAAAERGLTTGAFGAWLGRQRVLVFSVIALGAVAVILFSRPISTALVVWTIIIALLLVALVELLQRPADEVAAADAAAAAASEEAEAAAAAAAASEEGLGDTTVLDDGVVGPTDSGSSDADTAVLVEASGAELEGGVAEDAKATDVLDLGGDTAPKPTGPKKRGRPAE